MAILGMVLVFIAGIASLVFSIQILITAFKTSVGWGLASLFIPFVILVFVFTHWEDTKKPFIRCLIATAVAIVGSVIMGIGGGMTTTTPP